MDDRMLTTYDQIVRELENNRAAKHCILLDSDTYTGALFGCEEAQLHFISEKTYYKNELRKQIIEALAAIVEENDAAAITYELLQADSDINRKFKRYITSDHNMDEKVSNASGKDITCSEIEKVLSGCRNLIIDFIKQMGEQLGRDGISYENSMVFIVGSGADSYLIKHYYLSELLYDPFLEDPGVKVIGGADRIKYLQEYLAKLEEAAAMAVDIQLVYMDEQGKQRQKLEVNKGEANIKDYFGALFISADDALQLEVNGELKTVKLPYEVPEGDGDLVEVAAFVDKGNPYLSIKRSMFTNIVHNAAL